MKHLEPGPSDPILDLARVRDPIGVLTVMVTRVPGLRSEAIPGHRLVRGALAELDDTTGRVPDGEMIEAYRQRRSEIIGLVDELLDAHEPDRGRVLVVPLSGPALRLNVWGEVSDGAVLGADTHVAPLLILREQGRPIGLVAISSTHLHVVVRAAGHVRTDRNIEIPRTPSAGGRPEIPVAHQETERHLQSRTFGRRTTRHRAAEIAAHADELAELAVSGGWSAVAICGDSELSEPIRRRMAASGIVVIGTKVTPGEGWSADRLERALHAEIEHAARIRRQELAACVLGAGYAPGAAAVLGVDDVLGALVEGRVHHLVLAPDALPTTYEESPDGRLVAAHELPAGVLHGRPRRLPGLCDRMVAEAVRHGAEVTALAVDEAPELASANGAVALLRG